MLRRLLFCAIGALFLAGCSTLPAPNVAELPWRDAAFDYDPTRVKVGREQLFALSPELQREVADARSASGPSHRLKNLLRVVFGPDLRRFSYEAGHTTTAMQTWERRRGDCLSLTVLTYAVARALELDAQMQEVEVPVMIDRRGGFDVVNQHVNVLFRRVQREVVDANARDVTVDFEPDFASGRSGRPLSEEAILARYYNNIGMEHLARGQHRDAYAYLRAAIAADATHVPGYGNLAVLYRAAGMHSEAEQLLRHAIALGGATDVPLRAMHQLLTEQGRTGEAQQFAEILRSHRSRDPYYWIDLGLRYLKEDKPREAINALEQARDMTHGFHELHRYLAVAYWKAGEPARANDELALLASLSGDDAGVSTLKKKLKMRQ